MFLFSDDGITEIRVFACATVTRPDQSKDVVLTGGQGERGMILKS